jgi:uncharacterized membrane protein
LFLLAAVLLIGAGLRFVSLGRHGLWVDEGYTARLTELPVDCYHVELPSDTGPPLFYYLTRPAALLAPRSEFALRFLPALCGLVAILMIYLLATELFANRWSGLLAALLLAANRHHIVRCQEARNYSLYFLFALIAMWTIARLARGDPRGGQSPFSNGRKRGQSPLADSPTRRAGLWIGFVLAGAGMIYSHNIAWFCLAGLLAFYPLACWAVGDRRGGRVPVVPLLEISAAGLLILVLYGPWVPVFTFQFEHVMAPHGFWLAKPTFEMFFATLFLLVWQDTSVPADFGSVTLARGLAALAGGLVWLIGIVGWVRWIGARRDRRGAIMLACLIAAMLGVVVVSLIRQPVFMEKSIIFCLVVPLLGAAAIPAIVARAQFARFFRWAAIGLVGVVLVAAVVNDGLAFGEQWREATQWAVRQAEPNREIVVVDCGFSIMAVAWYVHDTAYGPVDWARPDQNVMQHRLNRREQSGHGEYAEPPDVAALRRIVQPGQRVWVILRGREFTPDLQPLADFLKGLGPVVETRDFLGVQVRAIRVDHVPTSQPTSRP